MGKNDFDIDFDFEEEYGFDPKSFLGTEEYDDNIDLNAFSDEELGLTSQEASEKPEDAADEAESDFDLDDDLDIDDFLNMGSQEETNEEEDPEEAEDWAEESEEEDSEEAAEEDAVEEESEEEAYEEDAEFEDEDLPEDTEPEEIAMNEEMEYMEEDELAEEAVFEDEELPEESEEETFQFDEEASDEEEEDTPKKRKQKKERKPIQMPKITLPKFTLPKLKTPNIFTRFYDLYFAPVLTKSWQQEPQQDPNNPRRRRKKTKAQIFKEVYLPPIIVCLCLILVMSFVIGSLSNVIEQRRIDKEAEQMQLDASISAAQQAEQATQVILAKAEQLAAGYDYDNAIGVLESLGDLTQYPEVSAKRAEYVTARDSLMEYQDPTLIPNLSFHVLVNDMVRAKADETYGGSYNRNFVTTGEFTKILTDLYSNGYVLVDFDSFVDSTTDLNGNEQFHKKSLFLPADKKPVMITETMVNYFAYMVDPDKDGIPDAKGASFASKLVVDSFGDIRAEYVDASGQTLVGNYDLVPILEDFIKEHPDFSYQGARAILAVTGDEGVFGYRINSSVVASKGNDYYEREVAGAKQIVQALKDKGYTIACYTYANKNYANMNANNITADLTSWTQQITSVIGEVDTFVFAKNGNISDYNGSAFQVMYSTGFRYFISNADQPKTDVNPTYIRQNRLLVTGETMAHFSSRFTGMFDCSAILDVNARGNVPTG